MSELSSRRHPVEWRYVIGLAIAAILLGIGAIGLNESIDTFNDWTEASGWAPSRAYLSQLSLIETPSDFGTSYEITARFDASWNGTTYPSNQVSTRKWITFDAAAATTRFNDLKVAKDTDEPVECYINPAQPHQGVLFQDFPLAAFATSLLTGISFGSAGAWLFLRVRSMHRRRFQISRLMSRLPNQPWCWHPDRFEGRCPIIRRWPIVLSIFVFWNVPTCGIVVLMQMGFGTQQPTIYWLAPPVILVGCALTLITSKVLWLLVRYSEPTLQVQPWPLMLGDRLECTLAFEDLSPQLKPMSVWLQLPDELEATDEVIKSALQPQTVLIDNHRLRWTIDTPVRVANCRKPFDVENFWTSNWQIHVTDRSRLFGLHLIYDVLVYHCPDGA